MTAQDQIITIVNRFDTSFRETDTGNYFLSAEVGDHSFSFCILDGNANKYIAIGDFKHKMKAQVGETSDPGILLDAFLSRLIHFLPVLRKPFKACRIIWDQEKYTLVPSDLFIETQKEQFLRFNQNLDAGEEARSDRLRQTDAVLVYSAPGKIIKTLERLMPGSRIFQLQAVLIETLYQNFRPLLIRPVVFIHLRESRFDVIILDHSGIHYANSFTYRNPEDLVYYIMFIFDQMELSTEQTGVNLMGKVHRNSQVYNLLFKYIRKVDFVRRSTTHNFSPIFNDIPQHDYFPLMNLNQCG
jgi:hypothetical protein